MATKLDVGHEAQVFCMDTNVDTGASGDEDGMLRLWSRAGERKDFVKVGPESINSVKFSKTKPEIFATNGKEIHHFDLRSLKDRLFVFDVNQDEINQIDLNATEELLAAADDTGHIKVINVNNRKVFKTLRKHTNLCSTICFRPNQTCELISGAFDCELIRWDFQRCKCIKQFDMNTMFQEDYEQVTAFVACLPFVHTTSITTDGGHLACGLENGTVHVFDTSKKAVKHFKTFNGHSKSVSQVHFTCGKKTNLVSGGNDGQFILWDISKPSTNINCIATGGEVESGCLKIFDHGDKINWLSSWPGREDTVLVADQTSLIHSYKLR